ncbi:outer membrane lipoprotein chaperone LolA [Marinomonas spartinae]|uniref:outer membrane lipoprotein chaperone LolA n=1 Tax=Marinomonas spartinae TaxID=1792290 RepID=UPI001F48DCF9|nr:outer membrane lipoprotein chaperone LolA [Marinomonas spartinae]
MIYRVMLIVAMVLTGFSNLAFAATDNDSATAQLSQLLEHNRDIKGAFHQETYDGSGKQVQESDGVFILAKPSRFLWNSVAPYPQRIISNGKTVMIWDVDLQQATKKPLSGEVGRSPAALLGMPAAKILPNYKVTKLDANRFRLEPKNQDDNMFKQLTLSFKDGKISDMSILDGLGQTTIIHFKDVEFHTGEPAKTFSLAVPDDVDVIQEGQ